MVKCNKRSLAKRRTSRKKRLTIRRGGWPWSTQPTAVEHLEALNKISEKSREMYKIYVKKQQSLEDIANQQKLLQEMIDLEKNVPENDKSEASRIINNCKMLLN